MGEEGERGVYGKLDTITQWLLKANQFPVMVSIIRPGTVGVRGWRGLGGAKKRAEQDSNISRTPGTHTRELTSNRGPAPWIFKVLNCFDQ